MIIDELIEGSPLFQKLSSKLPPDIKARCSIKRLGPGGIVVKKKDSSKYVYLLVEGELKVVNESENGNIFAYDSILPLSFVGELEVFADEVEYAVTIESIAECTLIQISVNDFIRWLEHDPALLMLVAKGLAKKMYPTSSEVVNIMFQPSINKVEYYIAKYCNDKIKNADLVKLEKKRQQMADEIGSSIKSVNRSIKKLKEEGLVTIKKGKIYVNRSQHEGLLEAVKKQGNKSSQ